MLGLAQSTASKHMKRLEDAGLVSGRRQGSWIIFTLISKDFSPYSQAMLKLMPDRLNSEPEVQNLKLQRQDVDRLRLCSA